jgi:hypothetical protein
MAFTVRDYHDLVRLLAEHPEWQLELRRLLMSEDLQALPGIVRDLAEAQRRAEERLSGVEERLSGVEERLSGVEERLSRLEEAVVALAEAQQRTERALQRLSRQVGGLSETVGGDIEDIAYIVLHDVLKREFDWQVGVLERSWQTWDGQPEEVNVFGQASDPAQPERVIWIVGEAKHNLTAREVGRFIGQVERARQHLEGEVFAVCFCYRARPEVQQMVRDAGLRMVFSYGKLV